VDPSEFRLRLAVSIGNEELWALRRETAVKTGAALADFGFALHNRSDRERQPAEAVKAMGALLQMLGEVSLASGTLLSTGQHYAGAALLRQVVEIEYLTWTFKAGHRNVSVWLNSTFEERMKTFSPRKLRNTSKGRFLFADYQNHCEQGGHPVPRGIPLLRGAEPAAAQLLLVDLLLHCWRSWDQVRNWLAHVPNADHVDLANARPEISLRLYDWSTRDPLYALAVETHPEPDPGR
jgi:hypothetical protein